MLSAILVVSAVSILIGVGMSQLYALISGDYDLLIGYHPKTS